MIIYRLLPKIVISGWKIIPFFMGRSSMRCKSTMNELTHEDEHQPAVLRFKQKSMTQDVNLNSPLKMGPEILDERDHG